MTNNELIEIYEYLNRYKNIFNVSNSIIKILKEKINYRCNDIVILNPTIDNLTSHEIFNLSYNNNSYFVPLWHSELQYDLSDNSLLTVKCIPELPDHIWLDEENNVIISLKIKKDTIFELNEITFNIGNLLFKIPTGELYIRSFQKYSIKKRGISKINVEDVYNINNLSDIIVELNIE